MYLQSDSILCEAKLLYLLALKTPTTFVCSNKMSPKTSNTTPLVQYTIILTLPLVNWLWDPLYLMPTLNLFFFEDRYKRNLAMK